MTALWTALTPKASSIASWRTARPTSGSSSSPHSAACGHTPLRASVTSPFNESSYRRPRRLLPASWSGTGTAEVVLVTTDHGPVCILKKGWNIKMYGGIVEVGNQGFGHDPESSFSRVSQCVIDSPACWGQQCRNCSLPLALSWPNSTEAFSNCWHCTSTHYPRVRELVLSCLGPHVPGSREQGLSNNLRSRRSVAKHVTSKKSSK
jgi:hypothetical protein